MFDFLVELFVILILWELLKLLIEKRKGTKTRKTDFKMELMETSALIFSAHSRPNIHLYLY